MNTLKSLNRNISLYKKNFKRNTKHHRFASGTKGGSRFFKYMRRFTLAIVGGAVAGYVINITFYGPKKNPYHSDLKGKTIIVTGANAGIGLAGSQELSKMGAKLILACRNKTKGEEAREKVNKYSGRDDAEFLSLDLANMQSIFRFVEDIKKKGIKVDVLINNAGVISGPPEKTDDGFPFVFGVNHLGPFLLTILLLNNNLFNEKGKDECRIVNVSSQAHRRAIIDYENNFDHKNIFKNYDQSKLANIFFTIELSKKLKEKNRKIITCSLHPGLVATQIFDVPATTLNWFLGELAKIAIKVFGRTPLDGTQTTLYCVLNPNIQPGKYYDDCEESKMTLPPNEDEMAQKLWKVSEEMVKTKLK